MEHPAALLEWPEIVVLEISAIELMADLDPGFLAWDPTTPDTEQ